MKHRLLPTLAIAVMAMAAWASLVLACDKDKTSSAQAASASMRSAKASATCTAHAAATCTAEQAAACKAYKGASAMTAVEGGTCSHASRANYSAKASGACPFAKGASAVTASAGSGTCSQYKGASAVTASAGSGTCSSSKGASAQGTCKGHSASAMIIPTGRLDAAVAGSGSCSGHGMAQMSSDFDHSSCDACSDMATCEEELKAAGTRFQVVPLKNGVMFVYTTDAPNRVRAVQAAMSRRAERMNVLATADKAKLCPDCRSIRGAIASGKLTREVVNIEGGCLTLMTSSDPGMVSRIYALAGLQSPARNKS